MWSNRDLAGIIQRNLYSSFRSHYWGGQEATTHPANLLWRVDEEATVFRSFHVVPFIIETSRIPSNVQVNITTDNGFLDKYFPDIADIEFVRDSDDFLCCDMSLESSRVESLQSVTADRWKTSDWWPAHVAQWSEVFWTPHIYENAKRDVLIHSNDCTSDMTRLRNRSRKNIEKAESIFLERQKAKAKNQKSPPIPISIFGKSVQMSLSNGLTVWLSTTLFKVLLFLQGLKIAQDSIRKHLSKHVALTQTLIANGLQASPQDLRKIGELLKLCHSTDIDMERDLTAGAVAWEKLAEGELAASSYLRLVEQQPNNWFAYSGAQRSAWRYPSLAAFDYTTNATNYFAERPASNEHASEVFYQIGQTLETVGRLDEAKQAYNFRYCCQMRKRTSARFPFAFWTSSRTLSMEQIGMSNRPPQLNYRWI